MWLMALYKCFYLLIYLHWKERVLYNMLRFYHKIQQYKADPFTNYRLVVLLLSRRTGAATRSQEPRVCRRRVFKMSAQRRHHWLVERSKVISRLTLSRASSLSLSLGDLLLASPSVLSARFCVSGPRKWLLTSPFSYESDTGWIEDEVQREFQWS